MPCFYTLQEMSDVIQMPLGHSLQEITTAMANISSMDFIEPDLNASLTITPSPTRELEPGELADDEALWQNACNESDTTVEDSFWPSGDVRENLTDPFIIDPSLLVTSDRPEPDWARPFEIQFWWGMPESVVYIWTLTKFTLRIGYDCDVANLTIRVDVEGRDGVSKSMNVTIPGNDSIVDNVFEFFDNDDPIWLPNVGYHITFQSESYGDPSCDYRNVIFPNGTDVPDQNSQRLLLSTAKVDIASFEGSADCDAWYVLCSVIFLCVSVSSLANAIAISEDMRFGYNALCQDENPTNTNADRSFIEKGLFQRHSAFTAVQNHLVSTGSLIVTDDNGDSVTVSNDIEHSTGSVCVDNATSRVFVVGGLDENGNAVDTIQVFQLDADLTGGQLLDGYEYDDGWVSWDSLKLDRGRYAAMCVFYQAPDGREFIIVINGMEGKASERDTWFKGVYPLHSVVCSHKKKIFGTIRIW